MAMSVITRWLIPWNPIKPPSKVFKPPFSYSFSYGFLIAMWVITRCYMASNVWLSLSDLHRPRRIATAQNATMATTSSAVTARSDGIWDRVTSSSASEMVMIEPEISRNIQCVSRWEIQKQIPTNHPGWQFFGESCWFSPGFLLVLVFPKKCQRCPVWMV